MLSRQAENRTPSYRFHRPSGQAVVTLNGRDFYLGKHGTAASRQAYDRLVAEWLVGGRAALGQEGAGAGLSLNELLAAYWRHASAYYVKDGRPTSELSCLKQAVRTLRSLYGRSPAASLGPLALKAVRQRMVEADLCRNVVNRHVLRIKQVFKWATQNELLPPSVYHGLQAVSGLRMGRTDARETEPVGPVAEQHVDAIQGHVARPVWAIIELQRLTGMRAGEVVIMRGCNLDTTGALWLYTPPTHKTEHHGHSRAIELGPRAQEIIRVFLKPDLQAFLFSPTDAVAEQVAKKRRKPN